MPALTYTSADFPFQPFTKIFSADINQCYTDIQTLLNTTGLDDTNVQVHGLTRNGTSSRLKTGTANYVVINGSTGDMSEEQFLSPVRGGLGISATLTPGFVPQVNPAGTSFQMVAVPASATGNIYNFLQFG